MEIVYIDVNELKPDEKNAKIHKNEDIDAICKSIKKYSFCDPIGVWGEDNLIVEGHGRWLACKQLGIEQVPCIRLDHLTDKQRQEYAIVHNKTTMLTGFDEDILKDILPNIDLDDFNFDFDLKFDDEEEVVEVDVPDVPEEPKAKLGDIYQLGDHRLMCGDSTSEEDVAKLMNGVKIDMIFTDPPYNVQFNGRSGNFGIIKNDNLNDNDFYNFIKNTVKIIKYINAPNYYIWCNWKFYGLLQEMLDFKNCIVWAKNVFGLGKGYRHQHEFCLFNGNVDDNIKNESDLWEISKDTNYIHPTQKPVALCARALKNHRKVINVLDLFGGSGSTLIACEQLNRKCYMMELDEHYIDVIIERWENFTGKKAVKLNV